LMFLLGSSACYADYLVVNEVANRLSYDNKIVIWGGIHEISSILLRGM
jgi:hypothetical protein